MTGRFGLSLLLAAAVALLVAGCGESSMGAVTMSKEAFIRQADLICETADFEQPNDLEAFEARYKKQLERMDSVRYESTVSRDLKIPSAKRQIREIEALEVPPGEERRFGAVLAAWKDVVREGERNPYVFGIWWNAKDPFIEVNKLATGYGFRGCEDLR